MTYQRYAAPVDLEAVFEMRMHGKGVVAIAEELGETRTRIRHAMSQKAFEQMEEERLGYVGALLDRSPLNKGRPKGEQNTETILGDGEVPSLADDDPLATALLAAGYERHTVTMPSHDSIVRLRRGSPDAYQSMSACALGSNDYSVGRMAPGRRGG